VTYFSKVEDQQSESDEEGNTELLRGRMVHSSHCAYQDYWNDLGAFAQDNKRVAYCLHGSVAEIHAAEVEERHREVVKSKCLE
jgi:hypothetical protein